MFTLRQGDIYMSPTNFKPEALNSPSRVAVAHGEGAHTHALQEACVATGDELAMELFARGLRGQSPPIVVDEPTQLTHGEHDTIAVPRGVYRATRQTEFVPKEQPAPRYD